VKELTTHQERVARWIVRFTREKQMAPTLTEVAKAFKVTYASMRDTLVLMRMKGATAWEDNVGRKGRTLRVLLEVPE